MHNRTTGACQNKGACTTRSLCPLLSPQRACGSTRRLVAKTYTVTACACRPEPGSRNLQQRSRTQQPLQQASKAAGSQSSDSASRIIKAAFGWAVLLPFSLCLLLGLAHAQPQQTFVPLSAIPVPSAHQPAAVRHEGLAASAQTPIMYQGAFASMSFSSLGHSLQHLHAAHFAKVLTYQAQRVSILHSLACLSQTDYVLAPQGS